MSGVKEGESIRDVFVHKKKYLSHATSLYKFKHQIVQLVLTPITANHNNGRVKRGMCGLTRHNPQCKLNQKNRLWILLFIDSLA